MASEQQYIDLYTAHAATLAANSCPAMNARRTGALANFRRWGFPSQKQERYRSVNVAEAFAPDYGVNLGRINIPVNPRKAFTCGVPNMSTAVYFVVNDSFYTELELPAALPEGVVVDSLCRVATTRPDLLEHYYARLSGEVRDGVVALNTLLSQDGLFVYIPRGVKLERTLQIIFLSRAGFPLMANRRVLVVMEDGAEASLLCCTHTLDDQPFLTTQVSELFLGAGASLHVYSLEETHGGNTCFDYTYARQEAESRLEVNTLALLGGTTRHQLDITLAGERASAKAYGCVVADERQYVENNVWINHKQPQCASDVCYKYVLDGRATGMFTGHVLVSEGAQQTQSQETNANLCVSPTARMLTQPRLEIYADDVKCNHGSTVGQLSEEALFYMRQRGIPEAEARRLLQHAFLDEVIGRIGVDALRQRLSHLLDLRFRGELGKCKACNSSNSL